MREIFNELPTEISAGSRYGKYMPFWTEHFVGHLQWNFPLQKLKNKQQISLLSLIRFDPNWDLNLGPPPYPFQPHSRIVHCLNH